MGLIYPDFSIHRCCKTMKIQGILTAKGKKMQKIFHLTLRIAHFPFFEGCCMCSMGSSPEVNFLFRNFFKTHIR